VVLNYHYPDLADCYQLQLKLPPKVVVRSRVSIGCFSPPLNPTPLLPKAVVYNFNAGLERIWNDLCSRLAIDASAIPLQHIRPCGGPRLSADAAVTHEQRCWIERDYGSDVVLQQQLDQRLLTAGASQPTDYPGDVSFLPRPALRHRSLSDQHRAGLAAAPRHKGGAGDKRWAATWRIRPGAIRCAIGLH
jgi:hypothetical protein